MTIHKNKAVAAAATGLLVVSLAACGGDAPQPMAATAVNGVGVADFSLSALQDEANLSPTAQANVADSVAAMKPGTRYTVVGFNNRPGSACTPLVFELQNASSGEEDDQRDLMQAQLPQAWAQYTDCMTGQYGSGGNGGSFIFGAIPTALTAAQIDLYPINRLDIVTDGCAVGEGMRTCSPDLLDPGFAQKVVDSLPPSLLPDLTGIQLTVTGLGVGTHLDAQQIEVLKEIWRLYAAKTHTTVRFA